MLALINLILSVVILIFLINRYRQSFRSAPGTENRKQSVPTSLSGIDFNKEEQDFMSRYDD